MKKTNKKSWFKIFDVDSQFGNKVLSEDSEYIILQIEIANPQESFDTRKDAVAMAEIMTKEDYYNEITKED